MNDGSLPLLLRGGRLDIIQFLFASKNKVPGRKHIIFAYSIFVSPTAATNNFQSWFSQDPKAQLLMMNLKKIIKQANVATEHPAHSFRLSQNCAALIDCSKSYDQLLSGSGALFILFNSFYRQKVYKQFFFSTLTRIHTRA